MPDEAVTIRAINWREAFPFTHLFRAFRVAIHPSKVVLALVALLLLYCGGRMLDVIWPAHDRAVPGEVASYEIFQKRAHAGESFSDYRDQARKAIESSYAQTLLAYKIVPDQTAADNAARDGSYLGQLKNAIKNDRDSAASDAARASLAQKREAEKLSPADRDARIKSIDTAYTAAVRSAYDRAYAEYENAKQIKNGGLFDYFFEYESSQISEVVNGVRDWNWFGEQHVEDANYATAVAYGLHGYGEAGVIQSIFRFFTVGPLWLLSQHPLYFLLFGAIFLILWAIFGGAISRIAAVHVAREEKVSIRSALKFSFNKFLSFLFAPIIPLLIILVVGIVLSIGSLVGNIPFLGPIIVGGFFFLALAAGFVMALVLLGLLGGFNLMYPTIAVEGSDSFDAISRSFSYLYARPWRLAFYTVVSVIYGALTYLFVRLFIQLMLILTHKFVGLGIYTHADSTAPLWPTMWPSPTSAARLSYNIDFLALDVGSHIGAFLVSFWVYLVIAVLGAFAISFYFSANTIIYYLMRREVDATDLDDVYLEQIDDEFAEPTPMPAAAPSEPVATEPTPQQDAPPA
jgi:hypothetical protein